MVPAEDVAPCAPLGNGPAVWGALEPVGAVGVGTGAEGAV
jgi:hypothetical protein